ncbi:retrovirus-related Pol polyprotein from transposon 412 [Trichonephila clavipes]|nr:retrovirus-related Pol polyprotein from transposon 412 [Trichonephila clavipes]
MESSSNKTKLAGHLGLIVLQLSSIGPLWNSLHLRNGVLYRKFESEDGKTFRWQLVLPRSRIPEVLKELHGSPTGGHFGVMKTLHRVRERFCWGKVRADVEQWCKSCDACSARKGPKIRSRGKLHRYNVGAPFERIAFDILGPLPRTASEPTRLGPESSSSLSASVPQRRSRDYRIFTIPDAFCRDSSPCDLLFGRPPDTPSSPEEYVQNLQARFEDVHNLARERINLRTEKMKTRYDTKATGLQFKEGDKVWFYNPTSTQRLSPKLQSHWDGPYTILKIINDVVIRSQCHPLRYNGDSMRTCRNLGGRARLASFLVTILESLATILASSEPSGIF